MCALCKCHTVKFAIRFQSSFNLYFPLVVHATQSTHKNNNAASTANSLGSTKKISVPDFIVWQQRNFFCFLMKQKYFFRHFVHNCLRKWKQNSTHEKKIVFWSFESERYSIEEYKQYSHTILWAIFNGNKWILSVCIATKNHLSIAICYKFTIFSRNIRLVAYSVFYSIQTHNNAPVHVQSKHTPFNICTTWLICDFFIFRSMLCDDKFFLVSVCPLHFDFFNVHFNAQQHQHNRARWVSMYLAVRVCDGVMFLFFSVQFALAIQWNFVVMCATIAILIHGPWKFSR